MRVWGAVFAAREEKGRTPVLALGGGRPRVSCLGEKTVRRDIKSAVGGGPEGFQTGGRVNPKKANPKKCHQEKKPTCPDREGSLGGQEQNSIGKNLRKKYRYKKNPTGTDPGRKLSTRWVQDWENGAMKGDTKRNNGGAGGVNATTKSELKSRNNKRDEESAAVQPKKKRKKHETKAAKNSGRAGGD